jgi:hypothetical protein
LDVEKRPTPERFPVEEHLGLVVLYEDCRRDARMVDLRDPYLTGELHRDTVFSASLPAPVLHITIPSTR